MGTTLDSEVIITLDLEIIVVVVVVCLVAATTTIMEVLEITITTIALVVLALETITITITIPDLEIHQVDSVHLEIIIHPILLVVPHSLVFVDKNNKVMMMIQDSRKL